MSKLKFYVTGVSGTGKSTLTAELNKRGLLAFDIDTVDGLCYWRNKETRDVAHYEYGIGKDWLDAHEWICDQEKLEKLLNNQLGSIVVPGLASNQNDFLNLFDKIFLLQCKEETFLYRLTTRDGDNLFAKDKSEQAHILSWYKDFEKNMLENGAIVINSENSTDIMADEIMKKLH
jgi:dephospho-CoA kinase